MVRICALPLLERKKCLHKVVRKNVKRVLYVDHVAQFGKALFAEALKRDLEGVVAKPIISPYRNIAGRSGMRLARYVRW
jgi:ATP-dependent DNA ligase